MKSNKLIWFGPRMTKDQHQALISIMPEDHKPQVILGQSLDLDDYTMPELVQEVLDQAQEHGATWIAGDFPAALAAALIKSQTQGGRFGKYVFLLPVYRTGEFHSWQVFL